LGAAYRFTQMGQVAEEQVGAVAVLFNGSGGTRSFGIVLGTLAEHHHFVKWRAIGVLLGLHMLQYKRQVRGIRAYVGQSVGHGAMDA